jgi:hypothetical protein
VKTKVVKLTPADKVGTPQAFEKAFEKRRHKGSGRVATQEPKLRPLENRSMQDRMEEYGIQFEQV